MSATRQSQQSPPSTESRSSSKASWAAKKSPALKSRTPAPKPGGKRSGGTPATLYQRVVACAPPGGAVRPAGGTAPGRTSGRLLAPVSLDLDRDPAGGMARGQRYGDLEHAVLVARGDLLGIHPVGYGQAPLEAAVADLAEAAALLLLLPLRPALAGDGEGRALQGDLDVGRVDTGEVTAQDELPVLGARLDRRPPGAAGLEEGVEIAIQIEEAAEERPRHVVRPRLGDQAVQLFIAPPWTRGWVRGPSATCGSADP